MNTIEEAITQGHLLSLYEDSEKADEKVEENFLDALWQSIYDVCHLIKFGVLEDVEEEEIQEAISWLKEAQSFTKRYQDLILDL